MNACSFCFVDNREGVCNRGGDGPDLGRLGDRKSRMLRDWKVGVVIHRHFIKRVLIDSHSSQIMVLESPGSNRDS